MSDASVNSLSTTDETMPKNVVVILLDSLNRHLLECYGPSEFETPNVNRLAARSVRFDRHMAGSLPCMPARHDILVGFQDFLWRPWGSIEVWEDAITYDLRRAGVATMLVSDHPHLFEFGGENYHTDFGAWEYLRGHEGDPWRSCPDPTWAGAPALPAERSVRAPMNYDLSRTYFRDEADFPGPKTMATAAEWLRRNHDQHERFFLFIDEFDPHEPFDTPRPWADLYDPEWSGPRLIWPPYSRDTIANGVLSERAARQVRANYGAKLSMIDHWLGRVLDVLEETGRFADTAVVLCTDHGHYLGERDLFGKPGSPIYREMGHIPLLVAWPGVQPQRIDALTTTVDIHATLADIFGVAVEHRTHGRSLTPLITGGKSEVRDYVLYGYWGREVHVTDGRWRYVRRPVGKNAPLSLWSNRWSTLPLYDVGQSRFPRPDSRAVLDYYPGSTVPVLRQPFVEGDLFPFWAPAQLESNEQLLFDVEEDPGESVNRAGGREEGAMRDLLRSALDSFEAPSEQLVRLGIS